MRRPLLLVLALLPGLAFGQAKKAGGGGGATYAAGTGITLASFTFSCTAAGAAQLGCMTTGAQSLSGVKTFVDGIVIGTGVLAATTAVNLGTSTQRLKGGANANGWLSFDANGTASFGAEVFAATNLIHGVGGALQSTAGSPVVLQSGITPGASVVSAIIRSNTNYNVAGAKLLSLRNNTSAEVVAFPWEGGIRLNAQGTAEPTCTEARRGEIIYVRGGTGVGETIRACLKDPTNESYAWYTLITST